MKTKNKFYEDITKSDSIPVDDILGSRYNSPKVLIIKNIPTHGLFLFAALALTSPVTRTNNGFLAITSYMTCSKLNKNRQTHYVLETR